MNCKARAHFIICNNFAFYTILEQNVSALLQIVLTKLADSTFQPSDFFSTL